MYSINAETNTQFVSKADFPKHVKEHLDYLCQNHKEKLEEKWNASQCKLFIEEKYEQFPSICPSPKSWYVAISDVAVEIYHQILDEIYTEKMSLDDFKREVKILSFEFVFRNTEKAETYWETEKWQRILNNDYESKKPKCPSPVLWSTAIADVAAKFYITTQW